MVLATAVAGGVDLIVSEDNDLRDLESHEGIPIISAAAFLALLDAESGRSPQR